MILLLTPRGMVWIAGNDPMSLTCILPDRPKCASLLRSCRSELDVLHNACMSSSPGESWCHDGSIDDDKKVHDPGLMRRDLAVLERRSCCLSCWWMASLASSSSCLCRCSWSDGLMTSHVPFHACLRLHPIETLGLTESRTVGPSLVPAT